MKIAVDARAMCLPALKGIGVYTQNLYEQIARLDTENEYVFYYDSHQKTEMRVPAAANFTVRGISVSLGDTWFLWDLFCLPKALKRDGIELLHSPANVSCPPFGGSRVVTVHDTTIQEIGHRRFANRLFYRMLQPRILRGVDRILTVSTASAGKIEKVLGIAPDSIDVIPNGISEDFRLLDSPAFVASVRKRYGIAESYLFNAGGESKWKNVPRLIDAFARIAGQYRGDLVVTGIRNPAIREAHTARIREEGLEGRVHLLEYVPREDLVALYNGTDLFVYPSLMEGFGFPPIEAMACGVPVAASDSASIPEVTGGAALLFDGTKTDEIAAAVMRVLGDQALRKELVEKGFRQAVGYRWQDTAVRTLDIFRRYGPAAVREEAVV